MGNKGFSRFGFVVVAFLTAALVGNAQEKLAEAVQEKVPPTQEQQIEAIDAAITETLKAVDPALAAQKPEEKYARLSKGQSYLIKRMEDAQKNPEQFYYYSNALSIVSGLKLLSTHGCVLSIDTYGQAKTSTTEQIQGKHIELAITYDILSETTGARIEEAQDGSYQLVSKFSGAPGMTKISLGFQNFVDPVKKQAAVYGVDINGEIPPTAEKQPTYAFHGRMFAAETSQLFSGVAFGPKGTFALRCDKL